MLESMCRICLAENIRMHPIVNTELQHVYEKITDHLLVIEAKPLLVCYICYIRLKHCRQLMLKSLKSEEILTQIINGYHPDRRLLGELSNFNAFLTTPVQQSSSNDESDIVVKEEPSLEMEVLMKVENSKEPDPLEGTSHTAIVRSQYKEKSTTCELDVKQEEPIDDFHYVELKMEFVDEKEAPPKLDLDMDGTDSNSADMPIAWSDTEIVPVKSKKSKKSQSKKKKSGIKKRDISKKSKLDSKKRRTLTAKKIKNEKPFQCDKCPSRFTDNSNLGRHLLIHTGEKPFKCNFCQRGFTQKSALGKHISIHTGIKPHKCELCFKTFIQKADLNKHLLSHTGEKPYKCDLCESSFRDKNQFNIHMRMHSGTNPYKCDICQRCFTQKNGLLSHMLIHTGEKPFKCDVCQTSFRKKGTLKKHAGIHIGEKPFKCEICQSCFMHKDKLNTHIRIHTGLKPFKCEICHNNFTQRNSLKNHMRIHSGEKPYKCEVCQTSFSQRSNLKSHLRIHSGEKPYKCEICQSTFRRKDKLNIHQCCRVGRKKPAKSSAKRNSNQMMKSDDCGPQLDMDLSQNSSLHPALRLPHPVYPGLPSHLFQVLGQSCGTSQSPLVHTRSPLDDPTTSTVPSEMRPKK